MLYKENKEPVKPFEFNKSVAAVFPDMIERSVPGYPLTISMISVIADYYAKTGTNIYDLGCSLGAVTMAIQQVLKNKKCKIIAIDNSEAMLDSCKKIIDTHHVNIEVEILLQDIRETEINNASVVVMNFTLQFIPVAQRYSLLKKVYDGLLPGGVFILSEKTAYDDVIEEKLMTDLHYHMKALNGYDKLEIANKRQALEDILVPETIATHKQRLKDAGFQKPYVWLNCINFVSLISIKSN